MTYELAKELKDAGFPQHENLIPAQADGAGRNWYEPKHLVMDEPELVDELGSENCKKRAAFCYTLEYLDSEEGKNLTVYIPTLSELIAACGDYFEALYKDEKGWWASSTIVDVDGAYYLTPEEAVANLRLALNKK